MRHWIVAFLLAVLPIQFASAAVASYCRHGADAVADHIGHHEHRHVAAGAADASGDEPALQDAGLGTVDNDCGYCHLSCAQPLITPIAPWQGLSAHDFVPIALVCRDSCVPDSVERPPRQGLARSASPEEPRIT